LVGEKYLDVCFSPTQHPGGQLSLLGVFIFLFITHCGRACFLFGGPLIWSGA